MPTRITRSGQPHRQQYDLPEPWESAIEDWVDHLRSIGAPRTTISTRRGHVRLSARLLKSSSPDDLTARQLRELLATQKGWSLETKRCWRASMKRFYEWAQEEGVTAIDPAAGLPKIAESKPRPRPVPDWLWQDLLASAQPRERLMIRLAGEVGLRRAEVAQVHSDDLIDGADGYSLIVHGKGGKQRVVPIGPSLAADIANWLPGAARGYLFPSPFGGPMSPNAVGKCISRLMPPGWTMHKLRHRFATRGYAGTRNLRAVQEALGHASVATTQRYTAVCGADLRAVSDAAEWPQP